MKRKLIPLLALTMLILSPAKAAAQTSLLSDDFNSLFTLEVVDTKPQQQILVLTTQPEPENPKPKVYTVRPGDTLSKIGSKYNVQWQRLWAKNKQLKHPDVIYVGDKITVPLPSEQLKRALPAVVALPAETPGVAPLRSYDSSNTYTYGYCTWYVKNVRGASLPNGLGNANTWYSRAAALGLAVGSTPKAGAAATTTSGALGHVAYVESVNADGTVNISEMNYQGWGVTSSRTVSASEFVYIY